MPDGETLRLDTREPGPGVSIIDVVGDITPAAEDALTTTFEGLGTANAVVFNFAGLDYLNSGGIGLLVTLLVRAQRQRQRLLACGLSAHYRQIFELTRLDDAIAIHDDEGEAVAAAQEV